jgi:CheY-like chemotaxis protein
MIALTGWGQDKDKARTSAAGFDHHLTKPVDTHALISLLDEYAGVRNRVTLHTP